MRMPIRLSRRIAIMAAAILATATAGVAGVASTASAKPISQVRSVSCNVGTLQGTYLFNASGFLVSGSTSTPFAFSGHETYDGAGNVSGVLTSSDGGTIASGSTFTGTYTVASDCTGKLTVTLGSISAHYDLYIAPSGNSFTYSQTDPGVVLSAPEYRAF